MKKRVGVLLMAFMLALTSIAPYAEKDISTEGSSEITSYAEEVSETTADTLPESEDDDENVSEENTGGEETSEQQDSYTEDTAAEKTPTEEASQSDSAKTEEESDFLTEEISQAETEEETEPGETETEETETEETGDPTADVETAADWEATLPKDLTGVWGDDIVKIAQSQLGYTESTRNFVLADSSDTGSDSKKKGYTRYGAWYGSPYDDWCAMFASFCLHYAGVPTSVMPEESGTVEWVKLLKEYGLYAEKPGTYQPVSGDLIFFSMTDEKHEEVDHVGIVESTATAYDENDNLYVAGIYTIEGNSGNAVRENYYDVSDVRILGYGVLPGQTEIDEETREEWEETLPENLSGDLVNDLVAIAQSQIGYRESKRNFTLSADWTKHGYTRYGAWYGAPYEDWGALFVSFCLYYADGGSERFIADDAADLMENVKKAGLYESGEDYIPSAGDVAFFALEGEEADFTAIISRVDTQIGEDGEERAVAFAVIEGDSDNSVRELTYGMDNEAILGFGRFADEKWDGFFDEECPERGGILVVGIPGMEGRMLTVEIPENAFTEKVTLDVDAEIVSPGEIKKADADETLKKVLAEAEKTIDADENIYDLFVLSLTFCGEDGEKVQPEGAIAITADFSRSPMNLTGYLKADIRTEEVCHISGDTGEAETVWNMVTLDDRNRVSMFVFTADEFGSPFVLMMTGSDDGKQYNKVTFDLDGALYARVLAGDTELTETGIAEAEDGTIKFSVLVDDDVHEIDSVLVNGQNEADRNEATEEDNDYIIEDIENNDTIVTITTKEKGEFYSPVEEFDLWLYHEISEEIPDSLEQEESGFESDGRNESEFSAEADPETIDEPEPETSEEYTDESPEEADLKVDGEAESDMAGETSAKGVWENAGLISDVLSYTDEDGESYYLIPIQYFVEGFAEEGYVFEEQEDEDLIVETPLSYLSDLPQNEELETILSEREMETAAYYPIAAADEETLEETTDWYVRVKSNKEEGSEETIPNAYVSYFDEDSLVTFTAEDGGVVVSVTLPAKALPKDAELHVVLQDTEDENEGFPEDADEETGIDFQEESETDAEAEGESEAGETVEKETKAESDANAEIKTETDAQVETESEMQAESVTEAEVEAETKADPETSSGTETQPEAEEAFSFKFGVGAEDETESGEFALDVFFLSDNKVVEPTESAEVIIDASEHLEECADGIESIEVWHIEETPEGENPVLVEEISDPDEAAAGVASFTVESFSEFEFHYTCSASGWAGFGANLFDENGDTISATVTGYDSALNGGRYTTTVNMPYTFSIEDFVEHFDTGGSYTFLYATVTDPNYGDEEHTFDVWPDEEQVGACELYGSEENPVVSVTIDGTAATNNPSYDPNNTGAVVSKTWHFTLTYEDESFVTIPIYGNADGANDNGGKYCPKYLEINLYFQEDKEAVLNLGNGNGTYSDGDYTGSNASGGDALRYGTGGLGAYADEDGKVTINLPSDNDLDKEFTVVKASEGTEGKDENTGGTDENTPETDESSGEDTDETEESSEELEDIVITLEKEEAYDYKLVGWINIATGDYYDVSAGSTTAVIDLSDDNVFYADWIAASYDHGSSSDANLREDTVSTADFVGFHMFDYNELFDLYSVKLEQNGTEGETWTDSGSLYSEPLLARTDLTPIGNSFIFQNNGTTRSNVHVLSHANPMRWNLWTANSAWDGESEYNFVLDAGKYWNVTCPDSTILGMLYDENEGSLGVHYVGDADYLFWVDEDGYYTYDSAVSGAAYNQSEGRFYVYNDNANAFFPYNGHTDERTTSNGMTNYWFGMNMEVNFYLPSATTGGTETNPVNQVDDKDMVFDFSGDDDIMIFVDGKLVSDMSGIHGRSYSRINFSTNTVSYSMGLDENGAPDTTGAGGKYSVDNKLNLSAGNHKMQIFYMERGASASNLKIQFNVAPVWEYETGDVQTITAEKTWVDSKGNPIEDPSSVNSIYNSVEVGLFDVLGAATDDTYGYTKSDNTYTVTYTDDSGVTRTYVYDNSGETPTLTYTEVDSNGNTVVNGEVDNKTDSEGRVLDSNGYVVAWLSDENLYIRIDKQTLNNDNGWYYAWELLDPDGTYEVLELSTSGSYTTSSTSENLTQYKYWSIIGDSEIENSFEGDTLQVILTEAAQEASNTLGNTKDAMGWVIVATENGITTQQVKFSQIAELYEIKNGSETYYQTIAGVTSQSEIDALGDGAIWYVEDAKSTYADPSGAEFEDFYLYCDLNGISYYLTLEGTESNYSLTVTSTLSSASTFCYDSLGELLVIIGYTTERVEIQANGSITIGEAEREAAKDDIRIYTLQDTKTSGSTFTAVNTFLPDLTIRKIDSEDPQKTLAGAEFLLGKTNDEEETFYYKYDKDKDTVTWTSNKDEATVLVTDENGTATIKYISDGTYFLTETKAPANGYCLLEDPIEFTVSEGALVTEGEKEEETQLLIEIKNTYNASGSLTLAATKEYTGAELTEDLFSFTITETTDPEDENPYTETVTNNADGSITFSKIDYTLDDVGTHTYEIAETAGTAGGVTYASNTITVTVVVADAGDGTLSTPVTVNGEGVTAGNDGSYNVGTFKNSYEASGDVTLTATKTISGISSTVKTFNFTLYYSNENFTYNLGDTRSTASTTDTLTEGVAQTVTFPTITYDEEGTYYFVIVESSTGTEGDGWTYDETEYHVTVVMEDNGEGNLVPTVTYEYADGNGDTQTAESADFTNSYKAAETSVQFAGAKYISNSNSTETVFTFELYEAEDDSFDTTDVTPEEVKTSGSIDASGQSFAFSKITYEEAGTHYYVIKEQELDETGWTISEMVYYITVEVTDNLAGQLEATVSYVTEIGGESTNVTGSEDVYDGFDFTNTYAATGSAGLTAVKSLEGRATSNTTFTFALYNSDENFTEGSRIETQSTSGTINASQQVSFTSLEYEYDSSNTYPMNYYYIIKETTTDGSGWTCDTGEYHVTVTVTDNGDGTLTTSPSYVYVDADGEQSSADNATFTNTYAATGALNLSGTKTLTGGTITDGQFTYTVMEGETQVATGTVAEDGMVTFTQIDYTYDDLGEHTYTITEDTGSDRSVQYDETEYTLVVTVTDNETGELAVSYTVDGEESGSIEFTNYQNGSLTITKAFTGLTDEQIASLTNFTITVTNSDGDTVATLTLDNADENSTYTWTVSNLPEDTYTVTETGYSLDGYEVIAKSGEVKVTTGADVSVDDTLAWGGEDTVEFTNDYTEVGTMTVSKYVVAEEDIQEAHEDTEYTVVITAGEDADFQWVEVTSDSGREIKPTIDGKTITFTIKENETVTISGLPAGEYTVEEQGSDAMTSEHCVPTYHVGEDETEEAPTVEVSSGTENAVTVEIENEYPISTYIMVQKNFNGNNYPEEGFTFTIEALSCDLEAGDVTIKAEHIPMPDSATVTITESGEIGYFGNIEYEHLGTYYYKITETAGSEENIDYDTSIYYIKVVVASTEGTHVETTDEYETKADSETDNYKDLEYTEAGIVTAEFTNTAYEELSIEKEVSGDAGDTSEYKFEITLINSDGTPYEGEISMASYSSEDNSENSLLTWISGFIRAFAKDEDTLVFEDGKATLTIKAGERMTLLVPSGITCTITEKTTDADTTTVYDDEGNVLVQAKGTETEAVAKVGTIADSTQVKFVNSYRAYFPIDEEIIVDQEGDLFDEDNQVKNEAVNEYNGIEMKMTTSLPVVTAYDLANGEFTLNFHEVLDHELVLDEDTADFSVYIGETTISTSYYRITFDDETGDDCNFHVDVDLTALYNDGIVTEDMLDGNTEITIFFFADLEGTGLNGSYTSTVWYDIYDGAEWLYTSNESVVEVYTYEIEILKYDASVLKDEDYESAALAGAVFGVYYDEDCMDPVIRSGDPYEVVSGEDGYSVFYGLADGTYYVKELEPPYGYELTEEVLKVVLGEELNDSGYAYEAEFANTPEPPEKDVDADGDGEYGDSGLQVQVGDTLTYKIEYFNGYDDGATVTITDTLDEGLDFVAASDGGTYDAETRTITWEIKNVGAHTGGNVTFEAKVNETALKKNQVENTAIVQVGDDPAVKTNKIENPIPEMEPPTTGTEPPTTETEPPTTETEPPTTEMEPPTTGTEPSESETDLTPNTPVNTDDNTPVGMTVALMIATLGILVSGFIYRRRRAD